MNENNVKKAHDSTPDPVPFIAYETSLASEREHNRRMFWLVLVLIAALVVTNLAWLNAWQNYDYVSENVTVESAATGHANYIGADGSIYNYGQSNGPQEETD